MELVEVEGNGNEEVSPKFMIKIRAAFYQDGAPNIEDLGLEQDALHQMQDQLVEFETMYISVPHIVSACRNRHGGVNIMMADGDKWSSDGESAERIYRFLDQLAVDLT